MTPPTIIQRAEEFLKSNSDSYSPKWDALKELIHYAKELEARVQSSALSLKSLGDENFENIEKRKSFEAKVKELEEDQDKLVWNLAGCSTVAMGAPLNCTGHRVYPALNDVSKLKAKCDALQKRIDEGAEAWICNDRCEDGYEILSVEAPSDDEDNGNVLWKKLNELKKNKVLILPAEENIKAIALNPEATITIKVLPAEGTV